MARRFLYFVRHGQYVSTTTPPEEPDGALTEIGRRQASFAAERLALIPASVIHYSTTQRTTETASIIASRFPNVPLRSSDLLRECIPCVPDAFKDYFVDIPQAFIEKSKIQAAQAFENFFLPPAEADADSYEILVSHGNLISHLVCRVLNAPCESWMLMDIGLCSFSEIMISSQGITKVLRHNDTGHLPSELRT